MGAEALAVAEKYRFKNAVISGRFCREDSNLGPSKNSSHLTAGDAVRTLKSYYFVLQSILYHPRPYRLRSY